MNKGDQDPETVSVAAPIKDKVRTEVYALPGDTYSISRNATILFQSNGLHPKKRSVLDNMTDRP